MRIEYIVQLVNLLYSLFGSIRFSEKCYICGKTDSNPIHNPICYTCKRENNIKVVCESPNILYQLIKNDTSP